MKPEDLELHDLLIRALKGMLKAYENWLNRKRQTVT